MNRIPKAKRPWWMPERKPHEGRRNANQGFYNGPMWRAVSYAHKRANPLCAHCLAKGISTPVWCTDHITPINKGGAPYDMANLQSLCRRCHDIKSAGEAHDKGRGGKQT